MTNQSSNQLVISALSSERETSSIEFKTSFDISSVREWCEIIKDIVAISNSGGGVIVIGLDDHGSPINSDISLLLELDPAQFTDKIHKYTGYQFSQFALMPCEKLGARLFAICIREAPFILIFEKPGLYDVGGGNQNVAFRDGMIFFRHGAKSEPANNDDLHYWVDQHMTEERTEILKNLRTVVEAPIGSTVLTFIPSTDETALPVRLSDDSSAPIVGRIDPDQTHPFRLKELVQAVNRKLPPGFQINQYDIQAIRNSQNTDQKFSFHYHTKYSGHQYSQAFANWIADQYKNNPEIFRASRLKYLEMKRSKKESQ